MKNKKGFTLVELISVILLLGVIFAISVPVVNNIMKNTKEKAYQRQIDTIIDAAKRWGTENTNLMPDKGDYYDLTLETLIGNGYLEDDKLIDPRDDQEITGEAFVRIKYDASSKSYKYSFYKSPYGMKYVVVPGETYMGIIYMNPSDLADACDEENSVSTFGTKTGCMKWYVFANDDDGDYIAILDHNTSNAKRNEEPSVASSPILDEALSNDTSSWATSLSPSLLSFSILKKVITTPCDSAGWYDGIDGAGNQIHHSLFYLDSGTDVASLSAGETSRYYWLFDNTDNCETYGCLHNDSNSTSFWMNDTYGFSDREAWVINYDSRVVHTDVRDERGVRPIVTIKKTMISNS